MSINIPFSNRARADEGMSPEKANSCFVKFAALCNKYGVDQHVLGVDFTKNTEAFHIDVAEEKSNTRIGDAIKFAAEQTLPQFELFGYIWHGIEWAIYDEPESEMRKEIQANSIQSKLTLITPEMAAELLERNTNNRNVRESNVNQIAAAIMRGEWQVNGDSIRISKTGVLLDGQHRLHGIVKSGVAVLTMLVTGLDDDVFATIDRGTKRTTGDALSVIGYSNSNNLAALAVLLHVYKKTGSPYTGTLDKPTTAQVIEMIQRNPDMRNAVSVAASSLWLKKHVSPSMAAFCYLIFNRSNTRKCEEFFNKLQSGAGIESTSPVLHLREFLQGNKTNSKTKTTNFYKCALIFKAFKTFCENKSMKTLRITTEGEGKEKNLFTL